MRAGIGSIIFLWPYFTEKPKEEAGTHLYEDALRRNQAREIRIQSEELLDHQWNT
jgi:hypothetical protein